MTDFKQLNFDELEAFSMDHLEGVFTRSALDAEQIGLSRFRYAPNAASPHGHRHGVQEEIYAVVSGSGRMRLDDEVIDLKQWDVIRVAPHVTRGFESGPDGLELIIAGGTRPPDGDGEMVKDRWT